VNFYFNYGYQSLILLFFILSELLVAVLLFFRGVRLQKQAEKWLAGLILLFALYLTPWMFGHAGWYAKAGYRDFLFFFPFHQYFLMGPFILFSCRAFIRQKPFQRKDWLHFIPASLYLLYTLIIAITDLFIMDDYYFYAVGLDKDFEKWYQISGSAYMVIYAIWSIKEYREYKSLIYNNLSYANSVVLSWIRNFLLILVLLILLRGLFSLSFVENGDYGSKWYYYLIFAMLSYYLSFSGLASSFKLQFFPQVPLKNKSEPSIQHENSRALFQQIQTLIETKKLYQHTTLSLADVAEKLSSNSSLISRAINTESGENFNDFINSYRVEAIKDAIRNGAWERKTLEGLAMEAGFNSKSTFLRAFKKATGMTPSAYRKSL
jgi:AraC-like DNA-binding protein